MNIHGFHTLTLLDYPGHVGATLFLGGCNFRCPFCQNASLVLNPDKEPFIKQTNILAHLKKRVGILEGVCITGGEPTLYKELPEFIRKIKELGYLVKLDTNGTNPSMIQYLYESGLIDFVAMDIKSSPARYGRVSGCSNVDMNAILASASYLMTSGMDYEFRTTVVRELHEAQDFVDIGQWLAGCKRYFLQSYQDSEHVIQPGFSSYSKEELESFKQILNKTIPLSELRGIDN